MKFKKITLIAVTIGALLFSITYTINYRWTKMRITNSVFRNGLAQYVGKNNKIGFINKEGKWIIEPKFDEVVDFYNTNVTTVKLNNKWGVINKKGKYIVEPIFNNPPSIFFEGLSVVTNNDNKVGFINKEGKWIIEPIYDDAKGFSEGLAGIKKNNKWGFINKEGKWIIEPKFDEVIPFENNISKVIHEGHTKYIDKNGNFTVKD